MDKEGGSGSNPATTQAQSSSQSSVGFSVEYLKTIPGMLKIAQLVLGLITFICTQAGRSYPGVGWVAFVGISAFLTTLILLLLHLFNVFKKIGNTRIRLLIPEFIYTGIFCVLFIIAAIVAAAGAPGNAAAGAAAFFAFLAAAVYGVDTFFQYRWWKSERLHDEEAARQTSGGTTNQQVPSEPPPKYEP